MKKTVIILLVLMIVGLCLGAIGDYEITGDLILSGDEKKVWFYEGVNYLTFRTPSTLAGNYNFVWPANDGTSGQVLMGNGSGVFVFSDVNGGGGGDMFLAVYDADEDGDIDVAAGGTEKSSWTQYCIPYLSNTTVFGEIAIGTANQYLKVNAGATGYGFDTLTHADVTFTGWTGINSITTLGTIATGTWQATDVGVQYGGTGVSTLIEGGILLGSGTSAITAMAVLSDGEFIVGDGTTDPVAESGATARSSLGLGSIATLSAIDISDNTNLAAGTNITLSDDTLNIDDAFLINSGSDTMMGGLAVNDVNINNELIVWNDANIYGFLTLGGLAVDTDTLVVDDVNDRVGIGVAPAVRLDVKTVDSEETSITAANTNTAIRIFDPATAAGPRWGISWLGSVASQYLIAAIEPSVVSGWDTHLNFYTRQGGVLTNALHLDENGNVGIGTANPGAELEIQSSSSILRLRDTGAIANATLAYIEFGGTKDAAWDRTGFVGDASSGNTDIYLQAEINDLHLGDSSSASVMNLQGGNVGIGTTNPTVALDVTGAFNLTDNMFMALGKEISVEKIRARGAEGLTLEDDGDNLGIFIENGGNVGIGLTTVDANYKLIIRRAANVNLGIGLQSSELAIAAFNDALSANIPMRFYASEFNLLNGNVGINETTPQDKLEVNGTVLVKDKLKFTQDDGLEYIDSLNDGYMDYGATTEHRFNNDANISGELIVIDDANIYGALSGLTELQVDTLTLDGDSFTNSTATFNGGSLTGLGTLGVGDMTITQGGIDRTGDIIIDPDNESCIVDSTDAEAFLVRKDADAGDVFVVDTLGGQVGINVTAPAANIMLDVYRASGVAGVKIESGDNWVMFQAVDGQVGGAAWGLHSGYPAAGDCTIREGGVANVAIYKKADGGVFFPLVYDDDIGTERDLLIQADGQIGYDSSSRRFKENIKDVTTESTKIYNLRPRIYNRIDSDVNEIGLIAEEVDLVFPEVISYEREIDYYMDMSEPEGARRKVKEIRITDRPETVNKRMLIAPMLKEMQKMRAELDALKARVTELEKK